MLPSTRVRSRSFLAAGNDDSRRGRPATMNPLAGGSRGLTGAIQRFALPCILLVACVCAAVYSLSHLSSARTSTLPYLGTSQEVPYPLPNLSSLVMVAGHSVYTSTSCGAWDANPSWYLEPYQVAPSAASSFLLHIRQGVEAAAKDPSALLLFSGGQTRRSAGPRSEAVSYWMAAEASEWFGHSEVGARALTEEYARDSFENLLFSVCRFRQLTGRYPANITVVSYEMKRRRFATVHRAALRFPSSRFAFLGSPIDPSMADGAARGEAATLQAFATDPYGCAAGGPLAAKRRNRNPFARGVPYPAGCPELAPLLRYCGRSVFGGRLPWGAEGGGAGRKEMPGRG